MNIQSKESLGDAWMIGDFPAVTSAAVSQGGLYMVGVKRGWHNHEVYFYDSHEICVPTRLTCWAF